VEVAHVEVGPFAVADLTAQAVVRYLATQMQTSPDRPLLAFALHVGGLNARYDMEFVDAMQQADLVYADGGSVVWLARRAGARGIERAATTDIGWELMGAFGAQSGRPPRVALLGGPEGLAQRAGELIEQAGAAKVVRADHGFHADWGRVLASIRDARPDILVVGLGAPLEMKWCLAHRDELPRALVLTCGGWFSHIVGDERRAPAALRRPGLEWIARLAQAPRRLGPRYARGLVSSVAIARQIGRHR